MAQSQLGNDAISNIERLMNLKRIADDHLRMEAVARIQVESIDAALEHLADQMLDGDMASIIAKRARLMQDRAELLEFANRQVALRDDLIWQVEAVSPSTPEET